jgi:hypothetical protein
MPRAIKDWSWKPDKITRAAFYRAAKIFKARSEREAAEAAHRRASLYDFFKSTR